MGGGPPRLEKKKSGRPEMDGFSMIENLENRDFNLIFTTAHDEFALKAIKVSAIDYLLKPVDKDELLASMDKI